MLHSKHITVAASTTEANSSKTRFLVNKGIISTVYLTFPPGCAGLVKVRIFFQGHPFLPVELDAFIRGDNFVFVYPIMFEIIESPTQIVIEIWNDDDVYAHTIDVQFLILKRALVLPVGAAEGLIAGLRSLFVREK